MKKRICTLLTTSVLTLTCLPGLPAQASLDLSDDPAYDYCDHQVLYYYDTQTGEKKSYRKDYYYRFPDGRNGYYAECGTDDAYIRVTVNKDADLAALDAAFGTRSDGPGYAQLAENQLFYCYDSTLDYERLYALPGVEKIERAKELFIGECQPACWYRDGNGEVLPEPTDYEPEQLLESGIRTEPDVELTLEMLEAAGCPAVYLQEAEPVNREDDSRLWVAWHLYEGKGSLRDFDVAAERIPGVIRSDVSIMCAESGTQDIRYETVTNPEDLRGTIISKNTNGYVSFGGHNVYCDMLEEFTPAQRLAHPEIESMALSSTRSFNGLAFLVDGELPDEVGGYHVYPDYRSMCQDEKGCMVISYQAFLEQNESMNDAWYQSAKYLYSASVPQLLTPEDPEHVYILMASAPQMQELNAHMAAVEQAWLSDPRMTYLGEAVSVKQHWADDAEMYVTLRQPDADFPAEFAEAWRKYGAVLELVNAASKKYLLTLGTDSREQYLTALTEIKAALDADERVEKAEMEYTFLEYALGGCAAAGIIPTGVDVTPQRPAVHGSGDVDCNDRVNVADAVLIARAAAGDKTLTLSASGSKNADLTGDGVITTEDLVLLLKILAKKA